MPGSACTCECALCEDNEDGGCSKYLPFASSQEVHSMGKFSDMLLCPKEELYRSEDGTSVKAHRSACVSGHCLYCKQKQDRFFGCPKHKGGVQRQVHPGGGAASSGGEPAWEVRWKNFTSVDEKGQATSMSSQRRVTPSQTGRGAGGDGDDDEDFDPRGGVKPRSRQVSFVVAAYLRLHCVVVVNGISFTLGQRTGSIAEPLQTFLQSTKHKPTCYLKDVLARLVLVLVRLMCVFLFFCS